ncbi:MAG: DUF4349 domain-containing protein [Johnsonella sp.]|nr:DUF4349 domain-containing protein [Johnsonella sp.]
MMKKTRYFILFSMALFLLFGCAARSEKSAAPAEYPNDRAAEDLSYNEMAMQEEMKLDRNLSESPPHAGDGGVAAEIPDPSRKLVKTIDLSLETKTFDEHLEAISREISRCGGYIEFSDIHKDSLSSSDYNYYNYENYNPAGKQQYANILARIPVGKLNSFVDFLSAAANMTYKAENTSDVTLQYIDMESRKKSLQLEQESLWKLLEAADNVDTIIAIQARLSTVRAEIENYESQLRLFDNQVEYSTVNISLQEVKDYQKPPAEGFSERVSRGFEETLKNTKEFFTELLIFLIIKLPIILLLLILFLIIFFLIRAWRKKSGKRKKASREEKTLHPSAALPQESKEEEKKENPGN